MRAHVVIKLNLVWEGDAARLRADAHEVGHRAIDMIMGGDKHVEVDIFDLDSTGSDHPSYSMQQEGVGEVPPTLHPIEGLNAEVQAELLRRKRCPCGDVHLKAGDIK